MVLQRCFFARYTQQTNQCTRGKNQRSRQWRFTSAEEIDPILIQQYVAEALVIAKQKRSAPKEENKLQLDVEVFTLALQADSL